MGELWIGMGIAVGSSLVIGAIAAVHQFYRLVVSMDISLKNLIVQNVSIIGKIDGHERELVVLKVDVADLRGQLHGISQRANND